MLYVKACLASIVIVNLIEMFVKCLNTHCQVILQFGAFSVCQCVYPYIGLTIAANSLNCSSDNILLDNSKWGDKLQVHHL